jgi:uncharacterized membrane protein YkvA (DUF1232 family)
MKNNILKTIILLFVILYVVSPVDAVPGPIDDIIVLLMGYISTTKFLVGQ